MKINAAERLDARSRLDAPLRFDAPLLKFTLRDGAAMRAHYQEHGYVVIRGLIGHSTIDAFMLEYERIKRSRAFIYFSQSIHRAIRPQLNEHGFIRESMQQASRLGLFPRFSNSIKQCIYHRAVSEALATLDGHDQHVSWLDMFFDLSTGTIDHADTWYMDTDPPGSLVAAWFALEDIDRRAGSFFVMPGSHRLAPLDRTSCPDHESFRKMTLQVVAEHGFKPKAMLLDKGDVILWHPFLIHGAFANRDPRFSRKSFTSHYFPYGASRRDMPATPIEPTDNPAMFRVKHARDALSNLALYARFAIDALPGRHAKMDMRRKSYAS
jgi:phytanoyl-CoA hydroxylase